MFKDKVYLKKKGGNPEFSNDDIYRRAKGISSTQKNGKRNSKRY